MFPGSGRVVFLAGSLALAGVVSGQGLVCDPWCGGRREDRGVTRDAMIAEVESALRSALRLMRPDLPDEVRVVQRERLASGTAAETTWRVDGSGSSYFQVAVSGGELQKMTPAERLTLARHEACHVAKHGPWLKRDAPLSPEERGALERDADRCVIMVAMAELLNGGLLNEVP